MSDKGAPHSDKEACELLDSLPYPVAINCFAGLSRSDHAALSLVSKSYRSLVVSRELNHVRSRVGHTEKYHYICLSMAPDPTPRWFILSNKAHRAHPIPSNPAQLTEASAVVAVSGGIYVIGGYAKGYCTGIRTAAVYFLDCWSHTWHIVPSMRRPRASAAATVVDGRIYVFGGCSYGDKRSWGEVFDLKTQTWEYLPVLEDDMGTRLTHHCVVLEGKIYLVDAWNRYVVHYLPRECKWGRRKHPSDVSDKRNWCVVDNLVYSCGVDGRIYWCERHELDRCDDAEMKWRFVAGSELRSLQKRLCASRLVYFGGDADKAHVWKYPLPGKFLTEKSLEELLLGVRLTSFGHNLLLFWDVFVGKRSNIWCAEISFKRMDRHLLVGNVEWSRVILTVDPFNHSKLLYSVSVDV